MSGPGNILSDMTFLWIAIVQPVFKPVHLKNWIVYLAHLRLTQGMAFMRMAILTSYSLDFLLENDGPFLTSPNTQKIELLGRMSHIGIDTHHQKGLQQCNQSITPRKQTFALEENVSLHPLLVHLSFLPNTRIILVNNWHFLPERGSPLYKLFGAGWGQKGVGGFF